ncbi:hypothetical protein MLD38_025237 [Melastoma candidum]|uniref:Uncharacterized protein n=1 Tax=Melastoma candidum TaxID=119954 RepID=A0ACB9NW39_9MYRT|nr:hypothetical protein MLD38_025237 [Melastoma candidum]
MGAVSVDNNGQDDEGASVGEGYHVRQEIHDMTNGVLSNGQCLGSSEEDDSRPNGVVEDGNSGSGAETHGYNGYQAQPQQGPVILWERFLPVKSVKVLLVENDVSTRQVLSALLQNCGYEVVAVSNGLQAWKFLEDLSDHVDLVLTEVAMPLLTGIGLLSKIMSHKTFRNIPVIMMSSHDSMGIVFKCLSKGAVDFLVKPIRKNELKNLWQHVWRRCHSSSGSGSESGTQTKRSTELRSGDDSAANSSSGSDEHDIGSNALSIRNGSDNGSGTQSSWTRKTTAIGSPKQISAGNEWGDAPDSTCAQVGVHTGPDISSKTEKEEPDGLVHATGEVQLPPSDHGLPEANMDSLGGKSGDPEPQENCGSSTCIVPIPEEVEPVNGLSGIFHVNNKESHDSGELPSLELSFKKLESEDESGNASHDNHNNLRHSDQSALSKFNTTSSVNQGLTAKAGVTSAFDNCSMAMKTERIPNGPSNSFGSPTYQPSNTSSENNVIDTIFQYDASKKPEPIAAFKSSKSSAFQPVPQGFVRSSWMESDDRPDNSHPNDVQAPSKGSRQHIHIKYHHHHHHYHYHRHLDNSQKNQEQKDNSDIAMAATAPPCGSSNAIEGRADGNAGNNSGSGSGSASGSNLGSNGNNGSNNFPVDGSAKLETDNGAAEDIGAGALGEKPNSGIDEERISLREAALSKFRQKRKERCFEKRVRYESRKKLAELRPRVRGQFVRQIASDSKVGNDSHGDDDVISKDSSCDIAQ